MRSLAMAGVVLLGAIVPALAQDEGSSPEVKPLTGDFYMAPPIDAEDPKAPADHIVMTITGDAAKSMWDTIKAKPQSDECVGRMAKWVGSMVCYGPGTEMSGALPAGDSPFMCIVGINLKNASVELGEDC